MTTYFKFYSTDDAREAKSLLEHCFDLIDYCFFWTNSSEEFAVEHEDGETICDMSLRTFCNRLLRGFFSRDSFETVTESY